MKIVGIITEYNPFHNGHLYHIQQAKERTGADAVIAVMSGNYVQRGAPAIMPKHLRAEVALKAGASMVIELPVCYAAGSAEYFAAGAVSLFEKLGCIDAICFGSECGDCGMLSKIAHILAHEPKEYRQYLKQELKNGTVFPRARQIALQAYMQDDSLSGLLEQPNNILGIEYIKALYKRNSTIEIHTIKRIQSGYHDEHLTAGYSSASAIRKLLLHAGQTDKQPAKPVLSEALRQLESQVPKTCIAVLKELHNIRYPIYANDFSLLLKYRLMTQTRESLSGFADITNELANRILNHSHSFLSFDQFCNLLKTRDMTHTRISRALFHLLLGITKEDLSIYQEHEGCQYAHILGFRKDAGNLFACLKKHTSIPLLTKLTQTDALDAVGLHMLQTDILASDLYESVITDKFKYPFISEYQQQIKRI